LLRRYYREENMGWWKALQFGLMVLGKLKELVQTGGTTFSFDSSINGNLYLTTITITPRTTVTLRSTTGKVVRV
jgi:hypothetical protein